MPANRQPPLLALPKALSGALPGALALLLIGSGCGGVMPRPEASTAPETPPWSPELATLPILLDPPTPAAHRAYAVNPTVEVTARPDVTVSPTDDTASWDLTRRALLVERVLPPPEAVRPEAFIARFAGPDAIAPAIATAAGDAMSDGLIDGISDGIKFAIDAMPSPYRPGYHLLRVTARLPMPSPSRPQIAIVVEGSRRLDPDALRAALTPLAPLAAPGLGDGNGDGSVAASIAALVAAEEGGPTLYPSPLAPSPRSWSDALAALAPAGPADWPAALATATAALASTHDGTDHRLILIADGHGGPIGASTSNAPCTATTLIGLAEVNAPRLATLARPLGASHHIVTAADLPQAINEAITAPPASLFDARLTLRFDPRRVHRYRVIGHDGNAGSPAPGATLGATSAATVLVEVALTGGPGSLGDATLRGIRCAGVRQDAITATTAINPSMAPDPTLARVALAAAVAEKLRQSWWSRAVAWSDLKRQWLALPEATRASAAELGEVIDAAAALDRRPDRFAGHEAAFDLDALPVLHR